MPQVAAGPPVTSTTCRAHRLDILGGTKDFVLHDTVGQIAIATVGAGAALLMLPRRLPWREWLPIWSLAVGMIASSWLARIHTGGYHNVSMPLFATVALLSPLGLLSLKENSSQSTSLLSKRGISWLPSHRLFFYKF